ncbi:hypothetical protein MNBD_GAMMA05-1057 [hydrothermal vent metagenome]|uniref:Lipoprotein n=1 Tax=hydrothermal vent metagenome TaxID=652676 RepID=A0A3B0WFS4_9ZZZZ
MKEIYPTVLLALLLSGCSTIERRDYYTPSTTPNNTEGPTQPACGFSNFGGMPDTYSTTINNNTIKVTTNQNFHPYFWGPWFLTIIPVFPITWVAEIFVNDDLQISIYIDGKQKIPEENFSFSITTNSKDKELKPSNSSTYNGDGYTYHYLTFPIDYDEIDDFILNINNDSDNLVIPFKEASRWSWSQWTPNC